jgi:hypothetical protein
MPEMEGISAWLLSLAFFFAFRISYRYGKIFVDFSCSLIYNALVL